MKLITIFLSTLLLCTLWIRADAQADEASQPEPVILADARDRYPLGLHLEILEDPGGELTIEDVISPEFVSRFIPSEVEVPNNGFSNSAFWIRLRLRNESEQINRWLLEMAYANMHYVDLYSPRVDGGGFNVTRTGALRSPANRDIRYPNIVFNLSIPSRSEQTIYIRFQNGASMTLPLTIWQPEAFYDNAFQEQIWHGLFLGLMVGLLGYNLFLFFTLRDKGYLYLVLLLGGIILFDISQNGLLQVYVAPALFPLHEEIIALTIALIFIPLILFNDSFVSAEKLLPRIHKISLVVVVLWGVLGLMIFITSYHNLAMIMSLTIIATLAMVAGIGILAWRKGFRATRFLMIAWAGLLIGLLLYILTRMGLVASNFLTENSYRIAFAWMAVCWSIALADRIGSLRAETESVNRDLQKGRHRLSQILEGLPIGVVVYGKDFKPSFVNRRVSVILSNPARNIAPDLSAGRTLTEAMSYYSFRVTGSDQKYPIEKMPVYRALQGEPSSVDDIEADLIDKRVPLEIWASPVRDDTGNVESAVVAFQDITERKQSEMALRASEKRFRVIVENVFDGIGFLGRDRKILYVSPSYEQLNGVRAEDMIGKSGVDTIHPDDRAFVAATFQKLLEQPGGRLHEEYRIRHQDGTWVWVETRVMNLLDDPHVQAVVLNSRDITERRKKDAELQEYREQLEQLVERRTAELRATNTWLSDLKRVRPTISGTADLPQACNQLLASIRTLLGARLAFLLFWEHDRPIEVVSLQQGDGSIQSIEDLASIVEGDSPLRKEIDKGQPVQLTADEVASLPALSGAVFQENGFQSMLLMPMIVQKSVTGMVGVALDTPVQDLSPAQNELFKTMSFDLAELAEGAQLLDYAQDLVVAKERNSLARELHDSVTQILFSASVLAESTPRIWEKDQKIGRVNMDKLSLLLRGALAEMRSLLFELRSGEVSKESLGKLLATLADAVSARAQVAISLNLCDDFELPANVTQVFYRIAREALNNVIKHAGATKIAVSLLHDRHTTELHIEDNGRGFKLEELPVGHLGLIIISEQATQIGADLRIQSAPGQGTQVIVTWSDEGGEVSEYV